MEYAKVCVGLFMAAGLCAVSAAGVAAEKPVFQVKMSEAGTGVSSVKCSAKPELEFVRPGSVLGDVSLRLRSEGGPWREMSIAGGAADSDSSGLKLEQEFRTSPERLTWVIKLKNSGSSALEVGDLALSLPMFNNYTQNTEETFERRVFRHAFVSGEGSWVYWQPAGGGGPYLLMSACKGTRLEQFASDTFNFAWGGGDYRVYIHSLAYGETEKRGTWRQERTSVLLKPGEEKTYNLAFTWSKEIPELRQAIRREGGLDVRAVPAMVVPQDLPVQLALGSSDKIDSVTPEFQTQTKLKRAGQKGGYVIYRIEFSRLGENLLIVDRGGRKTTLEFFVTQPLETVIKKRAAFIAANQQHRDSSKWYDGLFSLWDVRLPQGNNLLGPDNIGGQHPYAVSGSDDPSNSKGIFLSEKNVAYPDAKEIEALEYYLKHFVWGKLQRTDKETPHPYGIYGSDSWHQNRNSATGLNSGGHGQERMWRTFDYTTIFTLYYNLYRIAKANPGVCRYLDAKGYLERAYGTARAFYETPYNINMQGWAFNGWCDWSYKIGNFHEKYLISMIDALEREGQPEKARYLRGEWEKKVRFFVCEDKYPWTSEMPIDSTAFESTYAVARYALEHDLPAVKDLWKDKNTGESYSYPAMTAQVKNDFLERQLRANLACRGWMEPSYYHLGSDFRGMGSMVYCLSYMSQMGGWAILDYGVRFAKDPSDWVQLGYASMLSSWALVNCGDEVSNYGFFFPGKQHDGAAGWGFLPQQVGKDWESRTHDNPRGPWPIDAEIDHGFAAGVEGAAAVVTEDPVFGLVCFGGTVEKRGTALRIIPKDGVRQRLHVLTGGRRVHIALDCDGFARDKAVVVDGNKISFELEQRVGSAHRTRITIEGIAKPELVVNGKKIAVKDGVAEFSFAAR